MCCVQQVGPVRPHCLPHWDHTCDVLSQEPAAATSQATTATFSTTDVVLPCKTAKAESWPIPTTTAFLADALTVAASTSPTAGAEASIAVAAAAEASTCNPTRVRVIF